MAFVAGNNPHILSHILGEWHLKKHPSPAPSPNLWTTRLPPIWFDLPVQNKTWRTVPIPEGVTRLLLGLIQGKGKEERQSVSLTNNITAVIQRP